MADDSDNLGDLVVNITGDFSELQDAIDDAVSVAQDGAEQIADAMTGITDASTDVGEAATGAFGELGDSATAAAGDLDETTTAATDLGDSLSEIADTGALQDVASDASEASSGMDEASTAADSLGDALTDVASVSADAADSLEDVSGADVASGLDDVSSAADDASGSLEDLASAGADVGDSIGGIDSDAGDAAGGIEQVGESSEEAEGGLAAMAEQLLAVGEALAVTEALGEFVSEAIEVYGATQSVVTSFELLGQSSEEAEATISGLADMSLSLAVPFGTLEQSARQLTVALQGVPDAESLTTDALTAAANSAALTGKSFDTVTTALTRIEVTGAVTSRQLMNLGITWNQLADAMGVSVAQAQATLAKGGQDATADLQTVVAAINSISAGAAAAQSQTVLGQITILKNQVELLFDAIGQDIAPVVTTIVSALSQVVQEARAVATAFQQLPTDLQSAIVIIGLATAAVVPLTAAVGAFGLAVTGITALMPAFNSLLEAAGLSAGEEAAGETLAAEATTAHAVAAAEAIPAIEGLTVAEGEAAIAATGGAAELGLLGTAAAEAAPEVAAVGISAGAMTGFVGIAALGIVGLVTGLVDAGGQATTFATNLSSLGTAISVIGSPLDIAVAALGELGINATGASGPLLNLSDNADAVYQQVQKVNSELVSTAWDNFKNNLTGNIPLVLQLANAALVLGENLAGIPLPELQAQMNAAFQAANNGTVSFAGLTAGTQALIKTQDDLSDAVTKAQQSVTELTGLMQAKITVDNKGVAISGALAAAQRELTAAQDAWTKSVYGTTTAAGPLADSLGALATSVGNANTTFLSAYDTFSELQIAFQNSESSINGVQVNVNNLTNAWSQLVAAQLKATGTVPQWVATQGAVAGVIQTEANALQTLQNKMAQTGAALSTLQTEYQQGLIDPTLNAIPTLANLAVAFQDNENAINAYNKAVTNDQYTTEQLTGAAAAATDAQGNLNTVLVNGVATATMFGTVTGQAAQAQLDFQSATDDAGKAAALANLPITSVAEALGDTADAANTSSAAVGSNTQAVKDFSASAEAAANAAETLADVIKQENAQWAAGNIVVQGATGDLVYFETVANQTKAGIAALNQANQTGADDMSSMGEVSEETANQLLQVAAAADDAADAVNNLNKATGASKSGGGAGGNSSAMSAANALLGAMGNPLTSQFVTPGSMGGIGGDTAQGLLTSNLSSMAQAIANVTGQVTQLGNATASPINNLTQITTDFQNLADETGKTLIENLTGFGGAITTFTPAVSSATGATNSYTSAANDATTATTAGTSATDTATAATGALVTATAAATSATVATTSSLSAAQQAFDAATNQYATDLGTIGVASNTLSGDLVNVQNTAAALASQEAAAATAQATLTAATKQYNTDLANASTSQQQLNADLIAVGNAATNLSIITGDQTTATDAQTDATTDQTTATGDATTALTDLTTATSNATTALQNMTQTASTPMQAFSQSLQAAATAQQSVTEGVTEAGVELGMFGTTVGLTAAQLAEASASYATELKNVVEGTMSSSGLITAGAPSAAQIAAALVKATTTPTEGGAYGTPLTGQYVPPSEPTGDFAGLFNSSSTPASNGINLTVTVSGNTIMGAGGMSQVANKIGAQIITNLRTVGNFKL
jgi:hypothetical protein